MLDYYLQPFVAEDDKNVLSAVAGGINDPDNKQAIAQAPHHFEIWRLGSVDQETGKITQHLEFIADCSALVRGDIRQGRKPGHTSPTITPDGDTGTPGRDRGNGDPQARIAPYTAPGRAQPPPSADQRPGGSHNG